MTRSISHCENREGFRKQRNSYGNLLITVPLLREPLLHYRTLFKAKLRRFAVAQFHVVCSYVHDFVNHTRKEYARGDGHEHRAECLVSLLKPYVRVFRGISKTNLPGYVGFLQFLRNLYQLRAFEQAEMILYAA